MYAFYCIPIYLIIYVCILLYVYILYLFINICIYLYMHFVCLYFTGHYCGFLSHLLRSIIEHEGKLTAVSSTIGMVPNDLSILCSSGLAMLVCEVDRDQS